MRMVFAGEESVACFDGGDRGERIGNEGSKEMRKGERSSALRGDRSVVRSEEQPSEASETYVSNSTLATCVSARHKV